MPVIYSSPIVSDENFDYADLQHIVFDKLVMIEVNQYKFILSKPFINTKVTLVVLANKLADETITMLNSSTYQGLVVFCCNDHDINKTAFEKLQKIDILMVHLAAISVDNQAYFVSLLQNNIIFMNVFVVTIDSNNYDSLAYLVNLVPDLKITITGRNYLNEFVDKLQEVYECNNDIGTRTISIESYDTNTKLSRTIEKPKTWSEWFGLSKITNYFSKQ